MILAVFFDFDGVVVDTEWAIYQTWLETYQAEGLYLELPVYTQCIGSDFQTWSPKTHLEELTGKSFDWEMKDRLRQQAIIQALEQEKAMMGIEETLKWLAAKGVPMAVVSSSSHDWVDGWLKKTDLAHYFQTTICRGDAPAIKPAPDLYLEAARRFELNPQDAWVIEDSYNGLCAAQAAGMPTIAIPNRVTACLDFSSATHQLSSAQELIAYFESMI
jgi:HAD superfamily hydrolase (TIGR01509 family)